MKSSQVALALLFGCSASSLSACSSDTQNVRLGEVKPDSSSAGQAPNGVSEAGRSGTEAQGSLSSSAGAAGEPTPTSDAGANRQLPLAAAAGAGSTAKPADPNVMFEWRETQPGSHACKSGTYSGTFMCELLSSGFITPDSAPVVAGPVTLTLTKAQNGEFLEISNGRIEGLANGIFSIQAGIVGRLDCATNMLDAMTVDGVYGYFDAAAANMGTIEGTVTGTLAPASSTLSGTWNINWGRLGGGDGTCNGPFTATWSP